MKSDTVVGRQLSLLGGLDFLKKLIYSLKLCLSPLEFGGEINIFNQILHILQRHKYVFIDSIFKKITSQYCLLTTESDLIFEAYLVWFETFSPPIL